MYLKSLCPNDWILRGIFVFYVPRKSQQENGIQRTTRTWKNYSIFGNINNLVLFLNALLTYSWMNNCLPPIFSWHARPSLWIAAAVLCSGYVCSCCCSSNKINRYWQLNFQSLNISCQLIFSYQNNLRSTFQRSPQVTISDDLIQCSQVRRSRNECAKYRGDQILHELKLWFGSVGTEVFYWFKQWEICKDTEQMGFFSAMLKFWQRFLWNELTSLLTSHFFLYFWSVSKCSIICWIRAHWCYIRPSRCSSWHIESTRKV